ncbi:unnamed protein product [Mytilus coruscus]|uniref:Uncharacterized protein n=1 Tax=Mytilus coruscus TaxID=42192 RepID=A0A6J8D8L6_MYTCO|nr:unnamed protein product [Mytilus coruscus]
MVDPVTGFTVVTFCTLIHEIKGSNSTITASYTETYPKIVITICIALFGVILAVIIAKVANVCHDRAVIEDDASDISDNTRNIIRARLSLIALQRKARSVGVGQRFFRLWSRKANDTLTGNESDKTSSTVITVEEAKSKIKEKDKNALSNKLTVLLSNKIKQGPEDELKTKNGNIQSSENGKEKASTSTTNNSSPSSKLKHKLPTTRPPSGKKQENFIGPNVSRSNSITDSRPDSRADLVTKVSPGKPRDVTSATGVSISVSINGNNGNNKTKKSVTFQDLVEVNGNNSSSTKAADSSSNKSNLKKT